MKVEVRGRPVSCAVCQGTDFASRRGVMDTRGFSFLGMTWANRGCTEYLCDGCGFVMTFADP